MPKPPAWGGHSTRTARAAIAPMIERLEARCSKCGQPVLPGQRWDVDHTRARTLDKSSRTVHELLAEGELQPAHSRCNRSAGATLGNRLRKRRRPNVSDGATDGL